MLRQILLNYRRENGVLTLETKHDIKSGVPIIPAILAVVSLVILISTLGENPLGAGGGIISTLVKGRGIVFLTFIVSMYCVIREVITFHKLKFEAGTLRVETYGVIGNCWRLADQLPPLIFDRKTLPIPVSRIIVESRGILHCNYRYEIRIPFAATGRKGMICVCRNKDEMNKLEKVFRQFWNEVPYDETVWQEFIANSGKAERGKERLSHNIEMPIPQPDWVTVFRTDDKLILISESGHSLSKSIGHLSLFLYKFFGYASNLAILVAIGAMIYCWNDHKPFFFHCIDNAQTRLSQITDTPLMDNIKWTVAIQNEFADLPAIGDFILGSIIVIPLLLAFKIFTSLFFAVIRYPFWWRWRVYIEHTIKRPHAISFDWRTDRSVHVMPFTDCTPFFRVIPATPQTHWLLTNRQWFDFNPGWRQPFQVVVITPEGSFPLPVTGQEEQDRVVKMITDF